MSDSEFVNKPGNPDSSISNGLTNGIPNGSPDKSSEIRHKEHKHKSKDKDRDRDKYRDKHKSSHKDKDRERDRNKDKDRHSSSHKSSHKDKNKDRDRHKDRERSDKDKDRNKDRERSDKDRHRDKDKERSDKDKSKDRHKEKERGDKHRDKERSKDKERSRDDREKEHRREKEKSREDKEKRSSSSGDKRDKDRHSSHKSSHRDKDQHRERSSQKELKIKEEAEIDIKKEAEEAAPEIDIKEEPMEESYEEFTTNHSPVKQEPDSEEEYLVIKEESLEKSEEEEDEEEEQEQNDQEESEDDVPLASRHKIIIKKEELEDDEDEDDKPLISRKKMKKESKHKMDHDDFKPEDDDDEDKPLISRKKSKTEKKRKTDDDDYDGFKPNKKKIKKSKRGSGEGVVTSPTKKKKQEEEQHVWKWWEEEKREDGKKWNFLEHKGPVFPPLYERLPSNIKFYYNGEHFVLSNDAEEVAGFYARMLEHDYTTKEVFNTNFFKDWRKVMTPKEREKIVSLKKCDFSKMHAYFVQTNEERKNRSKEEKKALKEENQRIIDEYGWCSIDGHKQRIGNFKIEPPGLFRGRGEHPKQGKLKKRLMPEDIIINCSKDAVRPKAPPGHKWREVRHDPTVTWLACWIENVQGQNKYIMLNAASKLKGEKDWQKYETARRLHKIVDRIRETYKADWKSKEMRIRQRAVALYFIDKLALRAGNEKDEDQADTVGCCSLRVEHILLHEKKGGKEYVVVFDFLGKDSIRYYNEVQVEKRVFKNLQLFMENKHSGDDLFDRLNTQIMNKHLNELMDGLTAKVFRTYNASRTLQEQLDKLTTDDDPIPAKILSYNRANREVAILCNHQRSVPKTFEKSMANLQAKIDDKKESIEYVEKEVKDAKRAAKHGGSVKEKTTYEKKKKALERLKEQLEKLEISATDKEENKQIALGTSKLNYLDPRISVAWCKRFGIPIEKVYNKTQRQKFQWAIDMATADYNFTDEPTDMSMPRQDYEEEEDDYE